MTGHRMASHLLLQILGCLLATAAANPFLSPYSKALLGSAASPGSPSSNFLGSGSFAGLGSLPGSFAGLGSLPGSLAGLGSLPGTGGLPGYGGSSLFAGNQGFGGQLLGFGGGLGGPITATTYGSNYGFSGNPVNSHGILNTFHQPPTVLSGLQRYFKASGELEEGISVQVQPLASNNGLDPGQGYGFFGGPGALFGAAPSANQLEATIEVLTLKDFPTAKLLVVITESAVSSDVEGCPGGPILIGPPVSDIGLSNNYKMGGYPGIGLSNNYGMGGYPGIGLSNNYKVGGYPGIGLSNNYGMGGYPGIGLSNNYKMGGYPGIGLSNNYGMGGYPGIGLSNNYGMGGYPGIGLSNNYGMGGYPGGMDVFAKSQPDFGVITEVTLQAGFNTFRLQGLGHFTDLSQVAGRGLSLCLDVQIGKDGRPACLGEPLFCVKLGYSQTPEGLN